MGLFDSIFGNKTTQSGSTSSQGTVDTQNKLWPGMQDFLAQYQQQFSGPSINQVNPGINQYQTGAADNQVGVAGNPALGTGFTTASNIAQNGLTPAAIQAQMSPYIQSVVNPTIAAQNLQNQQALSNLSGNHATRGALGNNTGSAAAYMAGVQPAQQAQIAGLYDTGFRGAQQTALGSIGTQLQGTAGIGSLTGASTGANQTLGGLGNNIWQSSLTGNMTPFALSNQGVQGFQGLGSLAGTTQNSTGSSQGTSTQVQTQNPFQTALGVLGLGMTGFDMFNSMNKPKASGGAVVSKAEGGAVTGMGPIPFHQKVAQAFQAVDKMRAGGGRIEEDKGELRHMNDRLVPMGPGRFASHGFAARVGGLDPWTTGITPVSDMEANGQDPFMPIRGYDGGGVVDPFSGAQPFGGFNPNNTTNFGPLFGGDPFRQFGRGLAHITTPPLRPDTEGFSTSDNPVTSMDISQSMNAAAPPRGLGGPQAGGPPPLYTPPQPTPMADTSGYRSTILPMRAENGFRGFGQMATALMGASAHTQGMAQNIMAQQGVRNADRMAELHAGQLLGNIAGQPTLEAQKLPSQIALQEAQTQAAQVAADREFQSRLRREEAEHARALELQKLEAQMQLLAKLQGQMQGTGQPNANGQAPPNTVREWSATPRGLEPPATAPATEPPAQQSPPPIPFNNADPLTGSRYGSFASPYTYVERNRAGRGEHYIGEDGVSIYKRGGGNGRTGRTEDVYVGPYDADQARRLRTGGQ